MKQTRKLIALLLVLAALLTALPAGALAANKVKTLKYNTWYSTQEPAPDGMTVYKLKLSAETLVYVSWKGASGYSSFAEVDFCRDKGCSYVIAGAELYAPASGKTAAVLYPGTYYIAMMDDVRGSKVRFTALSASKLKPKNLTSAKATAIKSGRDTEILFDKKNAKARWYKLKLTKKQAVSIYGNLDGVTLYNSKLKKQALRSGWDSKRAVSKLTSKTKLAKGTYYLKITEGESLSQCGKYRSFFWK